MNRFLSKMPQQRCPNKQEADLASFWVRRSLVWLVGNLRRRHPPDQPHQPRWWWLMCWDLSEMRRYFLRLMDLPRYGVSWLWYLTMPQWQPFGVADFWYSYCCKMYESKPQSEESTFTLGYLGQFNSESAIHKLCLWPLQYHNNEYYLKGDAWLRKINKCNECISPLFSNHVKLKHKHLEKRIALGLIRIVLCIYINFTSN